MSTIPFKRGDTVRLKSDPDGDSMSVAETSDDPNPKSAADIAAEAMGMSEGPDPWVRCQWRDSHKRPCSEKYHPSMLVLVGKP